MLLYLILFCSFRSFFSLFLHYIWSSMKIGIMRGPLHMHGDFKVIIVFLVCQAGA